MSQRSSIGWLGCVVGMGLSVQACVGTVEVGGGQGNPKPNLQVKSDKIDLLLVVDNSRSMADKQEILARSMADLVQAASNPPCIDANGQLGQTPANPQAACPPGQTRRHAPISDIHIGVISTSLGGHGADSCPAMDVNSVCAPNVNTTNDDRAHLMSRTDACGTLAPVPTYQSQGFLAWDLNGVLSPAGISDPGELAKSMAAMVTGAGQIGCGFESQLESWYRFLADPEPSETITVTNGEAVPSGIDTELLTQRANFLRPDSMLVILQLSDENDCSIKEFGQFYYVGQLRNGATPVRMPRARQECATNPDDPCCLSCAVDQGSCPVDPTCTEANGSVAMLSDQEDSINLRCFDQKRRFGFDFLYPIDRYTQALTQPQIANRAGALVPNPIFAEFTGENGQTVQRSPELVFYANITGVPWQEIARTPMSLVPGFKTSAEMEQDGTWDAILGNGSSLPTSPYMIESIAPRAGISAGNTYNGGERTIGSFDDLQYSCIFPIEAERDCSDPMVMSCDCTDPNNDSPLCAPNPNDNMARTLQVGAKAYPSPRTMRVVKSLGDQGILTSICPAQIGDASRSDYAYRPVVQTLFERIAGHVE